MAELQFLLVGWGGVGWGWWHSLNLNTCWMLRSCVCLVIAHMLDATQLCLSCHCTHAGCYATVFVLSLHTCWMLGNCVCLVIAHMLDATQCQKMVKKWRLFFGGWFQYARIPSKTPLWRHEPMEKMGRNEHNEPTDHKWKSTPLQHFVHLQQNAVWISPRIAITAVTLFIGVVTPVTQLYRGGGMSLLGLFKHHLFNGVFSALCRCCQLSFSFVWFAATSPY